MPAPLRWFDAHLDLAYLAELGRDMHAPLATCRGRQPNPAVTLPSLAQGRVAACLATVFTEPIEPGAISDEPSAYPAGDADAAFRAGMRQLKLYEVWIAGGAASGLRHADAPSLRLGVLVENADPISTPDDLPDWAARGVVAVGLTWTRPGRYAHGNGVPSTAATGLTDAGRAMVRAIDSAGLVHDASHLNDRSLADLFEASPGGRVIASHSNARALLGGDNQRHLSDAAIAEIVRRGGVIGLNLFRKFLITDQDRRPRVDEALRHVEHVCAIAGDRGHVGLGSDMDGGLTALDLPEGISGPGDLTLLAEGLSALGWTDDEVEGFAWRNWARFWSLTDAR